MSVGVETPIAILRVDANAVEREVGQLLVADQEALRVALARIVGRLRAHAGALASAKASLDIPGTRHSSTRVTQSTLIVFAALAFHSETPHHLLYVQCGEEMYGK